MLDRIDLHVRIERPKYAELKTELPQEASEDIRDRVITARRIQEERLKSYGISCNAHMGHREIKDTCPLAGKAEKLLSDVFEKLKLSPRSYDRLIKVSRTIADLHEREIISEEDIAEAVSYRDTLQRM